MEKISHKKKKTATVIGAGLGGLSLAVELADAGYRVTILEKKSYLGGRASNTTDPKMHDPVPIGPHVFVLAYRHFRRFLKKIGAESAISWERKLFLEIIHGQKHHRISFSRIPDPFSILPSLITYPFMTWRDKVSHVRFAAHVLTKRENMERLDETGAHEHLRKLGVSENAINKFWRFFVLSLLNVPMERCSAAEFCLLTRYFARPKQRKFGFARVGLGDLYTKQAEAYVKERGGRILRNIAVREIAVHKNRVTHLTVEKDGGTAKIESNLYVSSLPPTDLRDILPEEIRGSDFFRHLNAFEGVPYISVDLWFDRKVTDKKFWALLYDGEPRRYLNTDFYDQSNIYDTRKSRSFVTSNIIYSKQYEHLTDQEITERTLTEIKEAFPHTEAKVVHSHVHRIPYVIYAPYPGMREHKLPHRTPIENLYLAGDWTSQTLPQCMEAAVESGYECAREILKHN